MMKYLAVCFLAFFFASPTGGIELFQAQGTNIGDPLLDKAMRQYLRAILEKDPQSFLALVPKTKPFRFAHYEVGTLKKVHTATLTLQMLATDFRSKERAYYTFFDDSNGYTYRLTVIETPFEKWKKEGTTFHVPSNSTKSYVRWQQEDIRWVLEEVGDTSP